MRRATNTLLIVLFAAVYLGSATGLLLHSRTMPPIGSGEHSLKASPGKAKSAHASFWLQRRHLPLRVPGISADMHGILVSRPQPVDCYRTSHVPRHPSVDYNSFPSSHLANKAPPRV